MDAVRLRLRGVGRDLLLGLGLGLGLVCADSLAQAAGWSPGPEYRAPAMQLARIHPEANRTGGGPAELHIRTDGTIVHEIYGEHVRVIRRVQVRVPPHASGARSIRLDLDGNGTPETFWLRLLREEWDHDGDGHTDEVYHFGESGELQAWDTDADGQLDFDWRSPIAPTAPGLIPLPSRLQRGSGYQSG